MIVFWVHVMHHVGVCRVVRSLELELQVAATTTWVLRTEPGSFEIAVSALNYLSHPSCP